MDTLSSSVSTLKIPPSLHSTPREFHHFKTPTTSHHHHFITKPTSSIPNKTSSPSFSLHTNPILYSPSSFFTSHHASSSPTSPPNTHLNPSTGYAAALLDAAQRNGAVESVQKGVRRMLKLFQNDEFRGFLSDPFVDSKQKREVMKEVGRRGRFDRLLVGLLDMLIERSKVGMVGEVLMEFERIYDELNGTKVVVVPSKTKIERDELRGIAERVQVLSGAIRVKVRNLVDEKLPPNLCS